ncbi:YfiT family bacillithiol transferase [Cohnella herbarum]|nr:putative metal-dependent hydrolase [Cohnella herbarum]
MIQDLRYPIGQFEHEDEITPQRRQEWITEISSLPTKLASALEGLGKDQLNTPYRPDGWTIRQVAHHIADSHLNSFTRFKLALTEEQPTIRPYYEDRWALLDDTTKAPVELSTTLIAALHERWVMLLRSMSEQDYARTFYHPGSKLTIRLDYALGSYAWHGRHHVAHITSLRKRMGW